jgi:hypothetical protein
MRAGVVLLFFVSIAGVIGIVSLLPSFVYITSEKISGERSLFSLRDVNKEKTGTESIGEITKQANVLTLFKDRSKSKTNYSSIIESILGVRGAVTLNSMSVSRIGTTAVVVVLRGIAPSRDSLVAFKGRLESAISGNKVDLPVSELAKSKDLQFSLTVTNDTLP